MPYSASIYFFNSAMTWDPYSTLSSISRLRAVRINSSLQPYKVQQRGWTLSTSMFTTHPECVGPFDNGRVSPVPSSKHEMKFTTSSPQSPTYKQIHSNREIPNQDINIQCVKHQTFKVRKQHHNKHHNKQCRKNQILHGHNNEEYSMLWWAAKSCFQPRMTSMRTKWWSLHPNDGQVCK